MGPQPAVSASYIKGLLAARCKGNASALKSTTKRRRRTTTKSSELSGGVVKRKYKRRKKRRRRAPARTTGTAAARAKPKKKTAEIAIQTSDYGLDEELPPMNVGVGTSNATTTGAAKIVKSETKVKKEIKLETRDKKPAVLDVIILSDDDVKPVVRKRQAPVNDGPSTSKGTGHIGGSLRCRAMASSDEEADERAVVRKTRINKLSAKPNRQDVNSSNDEDCQIPVVPNTRAKKSLLGPGLPETTQNAAIGADVFAAVTNPLLKQEAAQRSAVVHNFLFTPPIAAAIAKNLPMKSLNALSQVNPLLRDICRQEKMKKRRQSIDWFLRPAIIAALDGDKMQTEERIFGNLLTDLYCEPDLIIVFCSPKILYDYKINFDSRRSPHVGEYKMLHDIICDLMPAQPGVTGSKKIVHIRTHGVMPPVPGKSGSLNVRKKDDYGCKESPRDLCVLCIPKIDGVHIWREYLSVSDLRKQLRDSGWLESRSANHFLLPVIKDLEPLSPRLVIIFSRRMATFNQVASAEFPVIVLNTMDDYSASTVLVDKEYGLEWLAFGGTVTAFQVCIKGASTSLERQLQISHLRNQFSAQQVMSCRMLIFYFRNVTKYETVNTTEQTVLLERDIIQIREEFPRVPIFGGGYQNVIASCFTRNKTDPDFGKFFSGLHSAFVCGVVLSPS